ncbi:acetylglutamate kinase [Cerasicoccus arenae]|uniref:Acetylglutamate kinase n=1 Tax=Cerasicoccus arenae TaxID=424488 RepID=A0A8J3GD97_9BACT|nr:acetylglutamate kinase [Cerasicoccus arenae]MBK1856962.1 acetylglutamate kinase [Cerasicoccus arenae]GHB90079.1 acetylglutamate kinase [Cerasicoccus arenae]
MSADTANSPAVLDGIDITTKAKVLLEALPYIQRFRGSIFVVKYGGSFMDDPDPEVRTRVATDIVFLASVGIKVVVVHGGGKAISRGMEEAGLKPVFTNGLRVTDEAAIKIVEKTLNGQINLDICELIQQKHGRPLGIPGNNVFLCEKQRSYDNEGNELDLGFVGSIKFVKAKLIKKALTDGYTPIISPVALDDNDQAHNTNADIAAAAVASALRARRLVYLSDVPGLLSNPSDPSSLISTLRVDEVAPLKANGVIGKGMIPKVDSAVHALNNGVHRVHFVDGREPHSILLEIFTDRGIGTEIVNR